MSSCVRLLFTDEFFGDVSDVSHMGTSSATFSFTVLFFSVMFFTHFSACVWHDFDYRLSRKRSGRERATSGLNMWVCVCEGERNIAYTSAYGTWKYYSLIQTKLLLLSSRSRRNVPLNMQFSNFPQSVYNAFSAHLWPQRKTSSAMSFSKLIALRVIVVFCSVPSSSSSAIAYRRLV